MLFKVPNIVYRFIACLWEWEAEKEHASFELQQGHNQLLIPGGRRATLIKFHSVTPSCLFNRDTTLSQMVTDNVLFAKFPKMRTF